MAESGDDEADLLLRPRLTTPPPADHHHHPLTTHHHHQSPAQHQPPLQHGNPFGGSFQFIVQEQAKSMVAIQELQQEVGSLLLFRQAVLAALPHLSVAAVSPGSGGSGVGKDLHHHHPVGGSGSSGTAVGRSGSSSQTPTTTPLAVQTSWARRKHAAGYPPSSLSTDEAAQGSSSGVAHGLHKIQQPPQKTTGLSHQSGVADSGFSTEASGGSSNSNTSPRSSRFDGSHQDSSSAASSASHPPPPMEKELLQHLERVQQRLARLRKDEDRLLTLLNPTRIRQPPISPPAPSSSGRAVLKDEDELWGLLEEIETRSRALQEQCHHHHHETAPMDEDEVMTDKPEARERLYKLDRKTVSAVLKLTNPIQLQRHLLRALLDNQVVKDELARAKEEAVRWRNGSRQAGQQMAALKDENDDLRFQLEEQKIELEGTKARLRVVNSRTSAPSAANVTSVRVRTFGVQTEEPETHTARRPSSTQTDPFEDHHQRKALPCRVVDASPKPKKLPDQPQLMVNHSWATSNNEEDLLNSGERPSSSVEKRSMSISRIPTPIKPVKTSSTSVMMSISPSGPKRELPDIPTPPQRSKRNSATAATTAGESNAAPSSRTSPRPFQQQLKVPMTPPSQPATPSRPTKTLPFWAAWWRNTKDQT